MRRGRGWGGRDGGGSVHRVVPGHGGLVQGQLLVVGREGVMVQLSLICRVAVGVCPQPSLGCPADPCLVRTWAEAPGKHLSALSGDTKRNFLNYPL